MPGEFRIVAEHEAVILDRRAAAGGVDDDRVQRLPCDLAGPRQDVGAGMIVSLADRDDGSSAPQQPAPSDTTTSQPWRVSRRIVASLISGARTCWAQPVEQRHRAAARVGLGKTCGRSTRRGRRHMRTAPEPAVAPQAAAAAHRANGLARRDALSAARETDRAAAGRSPADGGRRDRATAGDRSLRYDAGHGRRGACNGRPRGRSSCRTGRRGSGRYA